MNEILTGNFDKSLMEGTIVLVRKTNSTNSIKDNNPISLLNYDYKLFSRIIKTRLEKRVPDKPHVIKAETSRMLSVMFEIN
jgi:hypothetical protein